MTGRTLTLTLAAWGCTLATPCLAQGYAGAGDVVTLPAQAGGFDYAGGAFGDGPAYGGPATASYGPATSPSYGVPNCPPQGGYGPVDCKPRPSCWWPCKCRPLFLSPKLLKPPRGSFVRVEYLLWEIEEPGNELVGIDPRDELDDLFDQDVDGAQDINDIFNDRFDPAEGFFTFDPVTGFETARTPRLEEIQLRDNSGIRLTLGIPTYEYGTIELTGWTLEQGSDNYRFVPEAFFPPFYGFISLDDDPEAETGSVFPGTLFKPATLTGFTGDDDDGFGGFGFGRVYDQLDVIYKSDLWGVDANFVVDSLSPPGEGLKFKPLFGFKYVDFQEAFYQRGFVQPLLADSISSSINSDTSNNIFGGTVGLRTELVHRWFVLGIEPAVTFAGNVSQARVATERFTGNDDPYREVEDDWFDFCPILDLNVYTKVCLTDNMNLTVGYDAFWLSRVYRPARVIDYRTATDFSQSSGLRSDFSTKREDDHVAVEGLSVGLEFVF